MTHPLPIIDGCLYLDNSQLEHFQTCCRQWEYAHVHKRVASESAAQRFGKAVHKALEYRYNEPGFTVEIDSGTMIQHGLDYLASNPCPTEEWRNGDQLTGLLQLYNKTYNTENFHIVKLGDRKFVEKPFDVPLAVFNYKGEKITVIYTGRIDLAVEKDGKLWVVDHKTSSMGGPSTSDTYYMSSQFLGYMWACYHKLKAQPYGYCVNTLISRKPTEKGTGKRFELTRDWYQKDWPLVQEWFQNTLQLIDEVFFHASKDHYPMKKVWCVGKFGKCQFYDVCSLPTPESRTLMLSSTMYKDNDWSPLKED